MTFTKQQADSAIARQQRPSPEQQSPPLSLGDKACIYEWLRDAAITGSSEVTVLGILRGAAERAISLRDFDEILLRAVTIESGCTHDGHANATDERQSLSIDGHSSLLGT